MGTVIGYLIGFAVLAAVVAQPVLTLLSRRYPRRPPDGRD